MTVNWNKRFFELAGYISNWSKDRSKGVGAVIADDDKRLLSIGYNGFPQGVMDGITERHERPLKYAWTEHAERNAIYSAAKNGISLKGTTMYIQWFPCTDCARGIIQSGIKEIVCTQPSYDSKKYGEDFKISLQILKEANIKITYITK